MDIINRIHHNFTNPIFAMLILGLILFGCKSAPDSHPNHTIAPHTETFQITATSATTAPSPTEVQMQAALTPTPIFTPSSEIKGCRQPDSDYGIIEINGHRLNNRTYQMLEYSESLYQGQIDITGDAITQGSYTNAVRASFGTHAGGGAVDLSVMEPGTYTVLQQEIEPLIHALRLSGFAAWYRNLDELYAGSPVHIHAIAIGDKDLSLAAREQLAGPFGYFWGYNGLPTEDGTAIRDPHGGPIMCQWMIKMGYPNKTATPTAGD